MLTRITRTLTRVFLLALIHTLYRLRVTNKACVPSAPQGALLVANHLSFVDAFLLGAAAPRPVRFLMHRRYFAHPIIGPFARLMGAIPVASSDSSEEIEAALTHAASLAAGGELVCIFAEGKISRTGCLLPFRSGLERIARAASVPIIPVALDGVYGSFFSFEGRPPLRKIPRRIPYPVSIRFGPALEPTAKSWEVRDRIQVLVAEMRAEAAVRSGTLGRAFFRSARRNASRQAVIDSLGTRLNYRRLHTAVLLARSFLRGRLESSDAPSPEHVALLLPAGAGGAIATIAATIDGRILVPLNWTLTDEDLSGPDGILARSGARHVITSRRFLRALGRPSPVDEAHTIYLEDMKPTGFQKFHALLVATLLPARIQSWLYDRAKAARDDATILFSSGSTGRPKGVRLSHANLIANIDSLGTATDLSKEERMLGVLPFFHAFGTTATLWAPLLRGACAIYHADPTDARRIGELCKEEKPTVLLGTPTFVRGWMRRIDADALQSLRLCAVGAERLRPELAERWLDQYGVPLLEGYGCTELSPVVSFNLPDMNAAAIQTGRNRKAGSVGRIVPGVALRIVDRELDPDSLEPLPPGYDGSVLVKSAGLMEGYLDDDGATRAAVQDGWYATGDIGFLDEEAFLVLTGRASRFSKIGGEMVPHGRVEEELVRAAEELCGGEAEAPELAVTAVPDERKGERLIVVHTQLTEIAPSELAERARHRGLPALFTPKGGDFVEVEVLPLLGSGKLDLKRLKEIATDAAGL